LNIKGFGLTSATPPQLRLPSRNCLNMPEANLLSSRSHIYSVPFGADFCDATVNHVLDAAAQDPLAVSNTILLLPNNRAIKAMTGAFVRQAAPGLLLPRMVAVGDLALDETLGPLLDPLTSQDAIWPAINPAGRIVLLAELIVKHRPMDQAISATEALRLARKLAEMIDELEIEQVGLERIAELDVEPDLAEHWQRSLGQIRDILPSYRVELARRELLGPAERRNMLLGRFELRLRDTPPTVPVIAAGITTAASAVARLLRRITRISGGTVILPGVDLDMTAQEWDALVSAPNDETEARPKRHAEVHPQFHLKLLLDRMGVARDEVAPLSSAMASSNAVITDIFCLPEQSAAWRDLPAARKKLPNVRLLEADDSAAEAKAIAVHVRGALDQAGKRVAVITPDRELAVRVSAQLRRWGIRVDDSAGRPLLQTPEGTLILALAEAVANRFSATNVLEIAKHPLVNAGDGRLAWLNEARSLDRLLRGPAKGIGLKAISQVLAKAEAVDDALVLWWSNFSGILAELKSTSAAKLPQMLEAIKETANTLTGGQIWKGASGRELARLWDEIAACNLSALPATDAQATPAILTELLSSAVVRPPYGGHPRVAIYGLLEARMQQADIVICAGLNETTWPQIAQPDPWLAPAIRRRLGLATLDRNIGLSAHDLATALGANEVLLTRAKRDRSGPTVASRFLLRIKALLGEQLQTDLETPQLAVFLDAPTEKLKFAERPKPTPSPEQRRVKLSITDFDQLKSDPYSFYAKRILRFKALDPVDAEPSHAWRGTLVHEVLQHWFQQDDCAPEKLMARADALLTDGTLDPLLRTMWQPRIADGLRWIAQETQRMRDEDGRRLLIAEGKGETELLGVPISGRADRIDALADGSLVIIDYKTGLSPKTKQINAGFALQLGLVGLMAERGVIRNVNGRAMRFEYWSLAKDKGSFGHIAVANSTKPSDNKKAADAFVAFVTEQAKDALSRWILGGEPFTAKLRPEFSDYADYDQLMRRQEWDGRQSIEDTDA
jgi:ATP-dependent helicase/nuclease subunit B